MRPRLLDLFCCAGIGADGYAAAGFDVTGIDVDPTALRHNPHDTRRADALDVLRSGELDGFDAIHASPPCQAYSATRHTHGREHPDLLPETLALLRAQPLPWVVENVPGAPMPGALTLCGSEFGLDAWDPAAGARVTLRRHRLFLASFDLWGAGGCSCAGDRAAGRIAGVYGTGGRSTTGRGYKPGASVRARLVGLDRAVPGRYLAQCIPPAYTRHVGEQLMAHVVGQRVA